MGPEDTRFRKAAPSSPTGEPRRWVAADDLLDAVYEFDLQGNCVYANQAARTLFGFEPDADVSSLRLDRTIIPEDREASRRDVGRIYAGETVTGERTFVRTDGARFVGEVHSGPVYEHGRVVGVRGVLRDVTARKRAEAALRESEQRFKTLFETCPQPIAVSAPETGELIDVNQKFCDLSGYEKRDVIGRKTWELGILPQTAREHFAAQLREHGEVSALPMDLRSRQGVVLQVLVYGRMVQLSGRDAILTLVTDVTEQKRLETQLSQTSKLEAIGTLAGGVAHDFNNLLTVIGGLASLARANPTVDDSLAESFDLILQQVRSGAALTERLLTFARTGKHEVKLARLNQLVERSAQVFARTRKEMRVEVACASEEWLAQVDKSQIEHMLLNLFVNAAQAMPGGGLLWVTTRNLSAHDAAIEVPDLPAGRYVCLSVADEGVGMDEPTRRQAFDPFFTTKSKTRGTGLGLASAYGIVKHHGGAIRVQSEPGKGSRFDIFLPAWGGPAPSEDERPVPAARGSGLVLVVDDEAPVLDITESMLRHLGYEVISARSGSEALTSFRARTGEIDLVILDMVMPGMGGAAVFDALRAIEADIAVLLVSGYSCGDEARDLIARGCKGFVQKPFDVETLSREVATVLEKASGA